MTSLDERDKEVLNNPLSKIVTFDDDDMEVKIIQHIFKQLHFKYSGFNKKPVGFDYMQLKDNLKWNGLKAKDYVPLITQMFYSYVKSLKG